MLSIHDLPGVEEFRRRHKIDSYRLRQLRNAFYKKHLPADAALAELPDAQRAIFATEVEFHPLELQSRHDSQLDGASKLIFRTSQKLLIEAVIPRVIRWAPISPPPAANWSGKSIDCKRPNVPPCGKARLLSAAGQNLSAGATLNRQRA
ncbi:MAG: hypothetical protein HY288_11990 [Planctomycetia bacterium]|nr:hypothetical protein [Planctomycetia bacterium]